MRKGFLLGVAVVFTIVGASQVFGQAASPGSRRARGAELRRLLRAVEGADEKPARTFRTPEGYVRFLSAPAATRFSVAAGSPEEQAETFLGGLRDLGG